jgi:plasmid stabilization system protein ParE
MPRIVWSQRALLDLARLRDFWKTQSMEVARRAIRAIRAGVRILERHPQAGRIAGEKHPEMREWVIEFGQGAYVVLYRIAEDRVVILAVRHNREAGD